MSGKIKNHVPFRMCIVCRDKYIQDNLLRISFNNGDISISLNLSCHGRGCYVCNMGKCMKKLKKQIVENGLRTGLTDDQWSKLDFQLKNFPTESKNNKRLN